MIFSVFQKNRVFGILGPPRNHASRRIRDLWSKSVSLILEYFSTFLSFCILDDFFHFSKKSGLGYSWSTLLWHRCYYPHRSRDALSPVCGIFFFNLRNFFKNLRKSHKNPPKKTKKSIKNPTTLENFENFAKSKKLNECWKVPINHFFLNSLNILMIFFFCNFFLFFFAEKKSVFFLLLVFQY